VVFVAAPSPWPSVALPGVAFAQQQAYAELAAELRDQARRGAEDLGIPVLFLYRRGEPYHELCRAATEVRADLVVIGASAGLAHKVAPSTGSRLVKARRWPVVVVP
jgi:nucleotide-binding universal stress UspA family protein